jgi:hypothetical protein
MNFMVEAAEVDLQEKTMVRTTMCCTNH